MVIPDSNTGEEVVVASLTEGNYFGEISLLRLDEGKNRLEKKDFSMIVVMFVSGSGKMLT